ncbi:MAG: hypothetical protein RLY66_690 [Candidatus Parcubacteria bacterium]|jgi:prepilin-type N-terminal cleavage/methylation domain-containing protein
MFKCRRFYYASTDYAVVVADNYAQIFQQGSLVSCDTICELMKINRGFTLIELLVVISIIGMLSSIVMVSVASARTKARDSKRLQQIRQIDLAVQLYVSDNNRAPNLQGTCGAAVYSGGSSSCVANSSANDAVWARFKADISRYMPNVPGDPCISGCTSLNPTYGLGYTYIAPAAVKYQCAGDSGGTCSLSNSVLDQYYQLYAPLEKATVPAGVKSIGSSFFTPPTPGGSGGYGY